MVKAAAQLTGPMNAAIERMRRTQSVALVRVGSQWWAAENDVPRESAAMYTSDSGELTFAFPTFPTPTISGLVARGVLKFHGRKRRTWWPPHSVVPFKAVFRY
jgi:hypothetical protein